jgi:glycosyltransferase involved in cell wall biosynthesis
LSNLQPSKGIEDVIDALSLINTEQQNLLLTVVGRWRDEGTKTRCLQKVNEQKLPVTFAGPVYGEEKLEYFSKADVFVFPPRAPEGHPLVLVEAMAAGLPIVSTDQGAITESVIDNENGFIVEPKRPEQIAEKLSWLIKHPAERENMGNYSRNLYHQNFTREKMISNYKKVFQEVL